MNSLIISSFIFLFSSATAPKFTSPFCTHSLYSFLLSVAFILLRMWCSSGTFEIYEKPNLGENQCSSLRSYQLLSYYHPWGGIGMFPQTATGIFEFTQLINPVTTSIIYLCNFPMVIGKHCFLTIICLWKLNLPSPAACLLQWCLNLGKKSICREMTQTYCLSSSPDCLFQLCLSLGRMTMCKEMTHSGLRNLQSVLLYI